MFSPSTNKLQANKGEEGLPSRHGRVPSGDHRCGRGVQDCGRGVWTEVEAEVPNPGGGFYRYLRRSGPRSTGAGRRRRQDSEDRRPREPSAENEITQRTADKRQNRNPGRRGKHRRNQNKHRARKAQNTGTSDTGAGKQVTEKEGQGRG